jgi:alanyl-tRNA synthetase
MDTPTLRQKFLDYFAQREHAVVPSSALVPKDDPTLLFTNAGMVPFKSIFQGVEKPEFKSVVSAQRCMRAGGKHNDLAEVGKTARHHTFFEMLGNFSFGGYFKQEAIEYAWDFLTRVLKLPEDKLWVTVFETDDESANIWIKHIGVDSARLVRCGAADNFWSMGDVGPCGPCTEIFYDHGEQVPGGPPGSQDADGDRFVEIWNLVFMQYNMQERGRRVALPQPCVDTGMGLERIAAVMQGVHDNYEIDIFKQLITSISAQLGDTEVSPVGLKVMADHLRAMVFLISDHVLPSHEGRGYVLRRIIRRAIRYAYQAGYQAPFLHTLVEPCLHAMGGEAVFPDVWVQREAISDVIESESKRFNTTINQGMQLLTQALSEQSGQMLSGSIAFQLHDTHGFPLDLTQDIAAEQGVAVDIAAFEVCMAEQRTRAQAAQHFKAKALMLSTQAMSTFKGYDTLVLQAKVLEIFKDSESVEHLASGEAGVVILDCTSFYAEGGGQVGDTGMLETAHGCFEVMDTQTLGDAILHIGQMKSGELKVGASVDAQVNAIRWDIMANHTATHLLHAALRKHLGDAVIQRGSLVDAQRLRFDFAYPDPLTRTQCQALELQINRWIADNLQGTTEMMSIEAAQAQGALALFDEKYEDSVRVVSYGSCSKELCGGTHLKSTAEVGLFILIQETGIASGVRRIEAVTRTQAYLYASQLNCVVQEASGLLRAQPEQLIEKIKNLQLQQVQLEKKLLSFQSVVHKAQAEKMIEMSPLKDDVRVVIDIIEGLDMKQLRQLVDQLSSLAESYVVILILKGGARYPVICAVSQNLHAQVTAKHILEHMTSRYSGSGGGRSEFAQGAVTDAQVLKAVPELMQWIDECLAQINQ